MVVRCAMHTYARWAAFGLALLGTSAAASSAAGAAPLSEYEWTSRPLLIFAPSHEDKRLQQTLGDLRQRRCELDDRDMIIGVLVSDGTDHLADKTIPASASAALRDRYAVKPNQFVALLIGKDGGEKYRLHETPDLNDIFALIDGMPMRQDEMAQHPVDCGNTTR